MDANVGDIYVFNLIPKVMVLTLIGSEGLLAVQFLYFGEFSSHNTIFIQILALLLCVSFLIGLSNLLLNCVLFYFSSRFEIKVIYDVVYFTIIGSIGALSLCAYLHPHAALGEDEDSKKHSFHLALTLVCGILYAFEGLKLILDYLIKYRPGLFGQPAESDLLACDYPELFAEARKDIIVDSFLFFAMVGALVFVSLYNFKILLTLDQYIFRLARGVSILMTFVFGVLFVYGLWEVIRNFLPGCYQRPTIETREYELDVFRYN